MAGSMASVDALVGLCGGDGGSPGGHVDSTAGDVSALYQIPAANARFRLTALYNETTVAGMAKVLETPSPHHLTPNLFGRLECPRSPLPPKLHSSKSTWR